MRLITVVKRLAAQPHFFEVCHESARGASLPEKHACAVELLGPQDTEQRLHGVPVGGYARSPPIEEELDVEGRQAWEIDRAEEHGGACEVLQGRHDSAERVSEG